MKFHPHAIRAAALAAAFLFTAGCNQYGYRYKPRQQSFNDPLFADYRVNADTIDILVDTRGRRLQQIHIAATDGKPVPATSIDYPPFRADVMGGTNDAIIGPTLAQGPTIAHFDKAKIGPAPWNVVLEVQGLPETTILVGRSQ